MPHQFLLTAMAREAWHSGTQHRSLKEAALLTKSALPFLNLFPWEILIHAAIAPFCFPKLSNKGSKLWQVILVWMSLTCWALLGQIRLSAGIQLPKKKGTVRALCVSDLTRISMC